MSAGKVLCASAAGAVAIVAAVMPVAAQDTGPASAAGSEEPAAPNPDEMADSLNAQQQIEQSFTFTRTINGEVVETEKRSITYDRDDPLRASEAGGTALEDLKAAFNREALTRSEAFEEARLDFISADVDRNGALTAQEFTTLVLEWRDTDDRNADASDEETARQRQYRAFIDEIDPVGAQIDAEADAREKFMFMAGAAGDLSREDYIREYLLDFDSMDRDEDMVLRDDELMRFRALNRGETLEM